MAALGFGVEVPTLTALQRRSIHLNLFDQDTQ